MKVAIIDYGMGNLFSVSKALEVIQVSYDIVATPAGLFNYERAILPGVGAFPDGMLNLTEQSWISPLKEFVKQRPLLGICLGMQLFMEVGYENIKTHGLGIIPGQVTQLSIAPPLKLPHIGWNELDQHCDDPLFNNIRQNEDFYFVHSYCCKPAEEKFILASTSYSESFPAVVKLGKAYGVQFHPEKSGTAGLQLLRNFCTAFIC